jgi:hypothetical protein
MIQIYGAVRKRNGARIEDSMVMIKPVQTPYPICGADQNSRAVLLPRIARIYAKI